MSVFIIQGLK